MNAKTIVIRFTTAVLFSSMQASTLADDPFLHALYDRLHESPMQQKFRQLAPVPIGVVFLPWKGITEGEMREQFRLMKKLGFENLKQVMSTPEWDGERIKQIAWEEGLIPFWYGEGGWEPITPQLLERLGMAPDTPISKAREDPRMIRYQMEVIRRGIPGSGDSDHYGPRGAPDEERRRHAPDPYCRPEDVADFQRWLRSTYHALEAVNTAWNVYEVGVTPAPFRTWEELDRWVERYCADQSLQGREYGRVRDVLRFKATRLARQIEERLRKFRGGNPHAPTRTGGEMGLFLPFAWRAVNMEWLADTQRELGSFYPSIHLAWHFGEVAYEVARPVYMQASFACDLFKGGWAATWESTGGPQQLTGAKGWDYQQQSTTPGFTVNAGTITQLLLSYLAAGLKGAGLWAWNYRRAGWEGGEFALLDRQLRPGDRAVRAGQIAQAARRWRDEIWQAHKEPYVGILVNWDNEAIWAAVSIRGRDHFRHFPIRARIGVSRALMNGNIPWEYVTADDLRAGLAPRYRAIYLPAQLAINRDLLGILLEYVRQGGRLVLDAPSGWYDEHGLVLDTGEGTLFEQIFGARIADFQYSNNVPRRLGHHQFSGFILELQLTRARVLERFQTGEAAITENRVGKGVALILAFDASFACFRPGNETVERLIRHYAMGPYQAPYRCEGALVYRLAGRIADHYFLINDDEPKAVTLHTPAYSYRSAMDVVTGAPLVLGAPIELEGYSGRWLRFEKAAP